MSEIVHTDPLKLTRDDFNSPIEARWCPGCGDYSILAQMKKVLPELGVPKENIVFIAGIGCSSRFPYYVNTYGYHTIHGRAAAIASGAKIANPDLKIFVMTGDGDALSIGGNHFIHLCRRNIDLTVVLFNNEIYGLTKGQYSPTSLQGQITKSSPYGSIERPFNPVEMALAAGATFVARTIDRETKHMEHILKRAAMHRGTSFVEVYQNCIIFNDGAYKNLTDKATKKDNLIYMEDGKPFVFGQEDNKALNWNCNNFEVVDVDENHPVDSLITHAEDGGNPAAEFALASLSVNPALPTPIGVFRNSHIPTYESMLKKQIDDVTAQKGEGTLEKLLHSGNTFEIE